jgi:hypothetical protein
MQLLLTRTYAPGGTNGRLFYNGRLLVYTIELMWKNNRAGVSCIPEGQYELKKRFSLKFGWHLLLMNVPGRALILIHPANDAMQELKGCIATVTVLTGPGRGLQSRAALKQLTGLVFEALARKETIFLTIKSDSHEPGSKNTGAHAGLL